MALVHGRGPCGHMLLHVGRLYKSCCRSRASPVSTEGCHWLFHSYAMDMSRSPKPDGPIVSYHIISWYLLGTCTYFWNWHFLHHNIIPSTMSLLPASYAWGFTLYEAKTLFPGAQNELPLDCNRVLSPPQPISTSFPFCINSASKMSATGKASLSVLIK